LVRTPFEVSTGIFYHGIVRNTSWDLEDYKSLLPESWQSFDPIFNSFNAGKIGRRLIIVHGSTDETEYFSDKIYYPLIPTRGCLSSKEIWDNSGKLIESDQVKLINAFRSAGSINGFLVVIEIDDNNAPVNIEDIEQYMR
jgi:hypothetical protein